jgi:phosphatidylinositol glycan class V
MTADGLRKRHRKQLLIFTFASQVLILLLLLLCSHLPLFDASPWTRLDNSTTSWATSSLLRWDVFHLELAADERMYEHQWAFFPGAPNFTKFLKQIAPSDGWATLLQGGVLLAIACDSTLVLYDLSLHHLKSSSLSFLSAILSLLPSSPATLRHAFYAEPFFTWASYRGYFLSQLHFARTQRPPGMLACTRSQWALASVYFCLTGAFRSNGILLSGFILWGLLVEPFVRKKSVSHSLFIAYLYLCLRRESWQSNAFHTLFS